MFEYYLRILGERREGIKIVCCIPLDGKIINENDAAALKDADRIVVYTEFARKELEHAFLSLRKNRQIDFPDLAVIPHGVDRDRFYPLPELRASSFDSTGRLKAKQIVFGDLPDLSDSFIVLNASRPDKRKRIDLTIEGFAAFAVDKPLNVKLCLHHAISGAAEEEQINSLIRQFGIEQRVYLNPLAGGVVGDQELNLLYNACDVGINTSMGEGWGLVSFEHGATGAAQIVPDHTACSELWSGRAEFIPLEKSYVPEFSVLEMSEVSPGGVARALNNLYEDPRRRQRLAQVALTAAQNPQYSWDTIADQFNDLFVALAQ